jgi:hypothetical protein
MYSRIDANATDVHVQARSRTDTETVKSPFRSAQPEPAPAPSRVERYLAHLDRLSGGLEPAFTPMNAEAPGAPKVTVIRYDHLPEPGMLTALTYGLSLAEHPEWRLGKPELCVSVRSQDLRWAYAIGHLAAQLSGECPFCYGDTLNFNERISEESSMTAFVVFAPAVLDRSDFTGVDVGDKLPINIAGMYPIYDSERSWIREHGLEAFWQLEWDPYDVTRSPAV